MSSPVDSVHSVECISVESTHKRKKDGRINVRD